MSKSKKAGVKSKQPINKYMLAVLILLLVFAAYKAITPQKDNTPASENPASGSLVGEDLKIAKADISEKASFYPYKEAGNYMEVIALKAGDGSIRTALNTCQVCYDSGRGYYEQVGNTLVCQNCGNVFGVDDVEVVRGGCNPVPILQEDKTEDGEFITISGSFLAENQGYFARWKK